MDEKSSVESCQGDVKFMSWKSKRPCPWSPEVHVLEVQKSHKGSWGAYGETLEVYYNRAITYFYKSLGPFRCRSSVSFFTFDENWKKNLMSSSSGAATFFRILQWGQLWLVYSNLLYFKSVAQGWIETISVSTNTNNGWGRVKKKLIESVSMLIPRGLAHSL